MKEYVLRIVLISVFALSVGVAGSVFAETGRVAQGVPPPPCPSGCSAIGGFVCAGSKCGCMGNPNTGYYCGLIY
jgi:hypothetical protein